MPHTIYVFMDMVSRGVWNDTLFIHMWKHIVQAAPIKPSGTNERENINGMLAFPESSEYFEHEMYTMGFSGRPGGPEFYINLKDNYESHGPGKQDHSRILNDSDPCFAKVVKGTETIDLLRTVSNIVIKNHEENGGEAYSFSAIKSMNIVHR